MILVCLFCCLFFFFFKQKTAYEIMPSLVGSEMCIRDRLWRLNAHFVPDIRTIHPGLHRDHRHPELLHVHPRHLEQVSACLILLGIWYLLSLLDGKDSFPWKASFSLYIDTS